MKRIKHISGAAALAAAMSLVSCEHKELCYNHPHTVSVEVRFDWSADPDANPESMSLYLFPQGGGDPLRYEFVGRNGGTITVLPDTYDAVCLNSDAEGMVYANTGRFETFEVTTNTTELLTSGLTALGVRSESAPRAEGTEDERVALSPDTLWSGTLADIVLTQTDGSDTLTLYPDRSVCRYRVEIVDAENLKYVRGISASLSGMAGGVLPGAGTLSSEKVTVPFEAKVTVPDSGDDAGRELVCGELLVFGHCPDTDGEHVLTVYAVMSDGSKYAYTFDTDEVTGQIHSAADPRNVLIRLEGLPLPHPITNGGGFQPEVDDWEDITITLPM